MKRTEIERLSGIRFGGPRTGQESTTFSRTEPRPKPARVVSLHAWFAA